MSGSRNPIDPEQLLAYLVSGQTVGALMGDGQPSPKALYAAAYDLYNEGKFKEALPTFLHRIMVNHVDKRYYDGAGACLQQMRRFKEAITYHGVSTLLDITDPLPALRAAECNMALGNRDQARVDLEHALRHSCGKKTQQAKAVADRAEALLGFLDAAAETPAASSERGTQTKSVANVATHVKE